VNRTFHRRDTPRALSGNKYESATHTQELDPRNTIPCVKRKLEFNGEKMSYAKSKYSTCVHTRLAMAHAESKESCETLILRVVLEMARCSNLLKSSLRSLSSRVLARSGQTYCVTVQPAAAKRILDSFRSRSCADTCLEGGHVDKTATTDRATTAIIMA